VFARLVPEGVGTHNRLVVTQRAARTRPDTPARTTSWPRSGGALWSASAFALCQADLDNRLALPKQFDCIGKCPRQDCPKARVWHVPTPEPQHLRRCTAPAHEINEILILREHHGLRRASLGEDLWIFGLPQIEVANVHRIHGELFANPRTKLRRNVGVEPKDHVATTAWLTRLLANRKQA
jgi:hypothetical protein